MLPETCFFFFFFFFFFFLFFFFFFFFLIFIYGVFCDLTRLAATTADASTNGDSVQYVSNRTYSVD